MQVAILAVAGCYPFLLTLLVCLAWRSVSTRNHFILVIFVNFVIILAYQNKIVNICSKINHLIGDLLQLRATLVSVELLCYT
jgi:hypothetical protein